MGHRKYSVDLVAGAIEKQAEVPVVNRQRQKPAWREDWVPALPTFEGTLRVRPGSPPKLVCVISCSFCGDHQFDWPTTSGTRGTGGLIECCDHRRGRRLLVLRDEDEGNNRVAIERYEQLLAEWKSQHLNAPVVANEPRG
jgi:hypothetical protein